ncbi:MAG: hypothetical protein IJ106_07255 [Parasporobacterium sp.]|nr:hypothetical protein [Parasporobacterium sp.]
MKLLENHIPVFAKMTGIVNDDYYQDGPNGMTEASMKEVNGGLDFTAHSTAERHPPKVQKTQKLQHCGKSRDHIFLFIRKKRKVTYRKQWIFRREPSAIYYHKTAVIISSELPAVQR